jgi:site-specific recombinase XerD
LRVCGKGRKERVVLLSADAYAVLAAWLAQRPAGASSPVFVNARGQPLSVSGVEWQLRRYGQQVGVAASPHRLRHSFARQVTEAGMPLASVGKLLGHADLTTTQRYTAGADQKVAQAYQQAMQQLDSTAALPTPTPNLPVAPPPTPSLQQPAQPSSPGPTFQPTAWQTWAPTLPDAIRQACLALVARRWPTWKAQRRRTNAYKVLGELRRFWAWQQSQRPVALVEALRLADLQAYQTAQQKAGRAAGTADCTLARVLDVAQLLADHGQAVDPSLFRLKALPRPDSLPRHLSPAESRQLEAHLRSRLDNPTPLTRLENACGFVLAHTGLRASECLDLQRQDLDLTQGRLWVRQGKGLRDRVVYLSPVASQALQLYLGDTRLPPSAPLLRQPNGRPISYAWLWAHLGRLGAAAGVDNVTPHRLRHTLATQLLNAGMDITRIQKLLGHEHLNTTLIYAREQDATVEADYRRAMRQVELLQQPLSAAPEPVADWPAKQTVPVDNSV